MFFLLGLEVAVELLLNVTRCIPFPLPVFAVDYNVCSSVELPPGLKVLEDFVTPEEETGLLESLDWVSLDNDVTGVWLSLHASTPLFFSSEVPKSRTAVLATEDHTKNLCYILFLEKTKKKTTMAQRTGVIVSGFSKR